MHGKDELEETFLVLLLEVTVGSQELKRLAECSVHTVTDPAVLRARIADARSTGVMWTHGEFVDGLSSCSAAVIGPDGDAVGSLYVYGPTYRFPIPDDEEGVARIIRARAEEISAQLGHRVAEVTG